MNKVKQPSSTEYLLIMMVTVVFLSCSVLALLSNIASEVIPTYRSQCSKILFNCFWLVLLGVCKCIL